MKVRLSLNSLYSMRNVRTDTFKALCGCCGVINVKKKKAIIRAVTLFSLTSTHCICHSHSHLSFWPVYKVLELGGRKDWSLTSPLIGGYNKHIYMCRSCTNTPRKTQCPPAMFGQVKQSRISGKILLQGQRARQRDNGQYSVDAVSTALLSFNTR